MGAGCRIYGIRNCDTMKKAFAWLDSHSLAYDFHDYKKSGIDTEKLSEWCQKADWESLVNRRGLTWRRLANGQKQGIDEAQAIALMLANPSLIKRPVLEAGDHLEIGFSPERYSEIFSR